ncbi:DUF2510 domain-containing protein [Streptomyces sp. NPDC005925]|uniref:DUF2510 domain-containing protein n=1 Tax=Streptomyces sp. NPDC005925 TaxID=3157172 RepID=UPI003405EDA1
MTQATPPGWYPDPGQTSDGPATERWWDGNAWTAQTRPAGGAGAWGPPGHPQTGGPLPAHPYPAHPGYPGYPVQPAGGRRGLRVWTAVGLAVVVLACIGAGVYVLSDDGGTGGGTAASRGPDGGPSGGSGGPGGKGDGDGASPSPDGPGAPKIESGSVPDGMNGISLPIPDGWYGQALDVGASVTSEDSYKCPGDTSKTCTKGGAYSAPAVALGAKGGTAEEIAKADIAKNAEESYGGESYGAITSHDVLASRAVTVAGQKGYLVRWKAVTSKGSDGYVQSLAFPSPSTPGNIVVVRFGVDVSETQAVIDEITEGIEVSSGGGSGQEV